MGKRKKLDFIKDENGCFIVTSHRINADGYGYMYWEKREQRLHRFVYEECFGSIPDGLVVRHMCDNRSCINPEHLELGTPKENVADMYLRNRKIAPIGEKNGRSLITEETARKIKTMLDQGMKQTQIARVLGVSFTIVHRVKNRKSWKHVDL